MLETDYVFAKVPELPTKTDAAGEVLPVAFPFHYIQPELPHLEPIIREMYTPDQGLTSDIQQTGPAPVFIKPQQLRRVSSCLSIASLAHGTSHMDLDVHHHQWKPSSSMSSWQGLLPYCAPMPTHDVALIHTAIVYSICVHQYVYRICDTRSLLRDPRQTWPVSDLDPIAQGQAGCRQGHASQGHLLCPIQYCIAECHT